MVAGSGLEPPVLGRSTSERHPFRNLGRSRPRHPYRLIGAEDLG